MMLAAAFGATVRVIAEGADEEKAVETIAALLESDIDSEVRS
jgi:phosphotransferase system HPr-like phosphotransfer protein